MKKSYALVLFVSLVALMAFGQTEMDSLKLVIANAPQDTSLVITYRQLYKAHEAADQQEEMLAVAELGLGLSRKLAFTKGIDLFLFYKATALDILGRGNEAIPFFEEGLALNLKIGDTLTAASYYINIGVAYHNMGAVEKALENYLAAHDLFERAGEKEKCSKVLNNIGIIYRNQEKYAQAANIYQQSLSLKQALKDSMGQAASLQNLGAVHGLMNDTVQAIAYLEGAVKLYQKLGSQKDEASCYVALGQHYLGRGAGPKAKSAYGRAWDFYKNNHDVRYSPLTLDGLGQVALQESDFGKAEDYFQRGLAMSRQYGQREVVLSFLKRLSDALAGQGKAALAFEALQAAYALRDSLTEDKKLEAMEEMQARFDVRLKDNELKISQLELEKRTTERNWFSVGAAMLALLAMSIFFALRYRIRLNKRTAAHQSELQQQQIRQLEQENKLTALTAMLDGQEQERTRIANDLHDSLGGLLASIKSHFNVARQGGDGVFEKTNALIDGAATEVRRISHNMMPRALALAGLKGALEDLALDLQKQGLDCDLELIGLDNLSVEPTRSVMVYRIIQELTHNVAKHAEAKHLLLQAIQKDGHLTLTVEDDGKGFDFRQALGTKGMGLSSVSSRVQYLQGEVDWDSTPGVGTTVTISVPA